MKSDSAPWIERAERWSERCLRLAKQIYQNRPKQELQAAYRDIKNDMKEELKAFGNLRRNRELNNVEHTYETCLSAAKAFMKAPVTSKPETWSHGLTWASGEMDWFKHEFKDEEGGQQ